jgi:hypothetical protein
MKGPPTFASELTEFMLAYRIEKNFLRRKFIRLGSVLSTGALALEFGALLGRVYHDSPEPFITAFAVPSGRADHVAQFLETGREAAEVLGRWAADGATFQQACVEAFIDEVESIRHSLSGVDSRWSTQVAEFIKHSRLGAESNRKEWLAATHRMSLDFALTLGCANAHYGAVFGMFHPDSVATMFAKTEGERQGYRLLFELAGSSPPKATDANPPQRPRTLEEGTRDAQVSLARFCSLYYPRLLPPLDLETLV